MSICGEDSFSLDLSWIDEEEKLLQYQSFLQPSPLESIHVCCIFLDGSNQIVKVERTNKTLHMDSENSWSVLSTEDLGGILADYGVEYKSTGFGPKHDGEIRWRNTQSG